MSLDNNKKSCGIKPTTYNNWYVVIVIIPYVEFFLEKSFLLK